MDPKLEIKGGDAALRRETGQREAIPVARANIKYVDAPPAGGKPAPFVPLAMADSAQRKMMPVTTGVLDYFPDAISLVAYISFLGNQKHNPGQDLHWSRGKSDDHIDCVARHLLNRDGVDADGILEVGEMAWRALAAAQLFIEKKFNLPPSRGSKPL